MHESKGVATPLAARASHRALAANRAFPIEAERAAEQLFFSKPIIACREILKVALEVSAGIKHANDVHVIGFNREKNGVGYHKDNDRGRGADRNSADRRAETARAIQNGFPAQDGTSEFALVRM